VLTVIKIPPLVMKYMIEFVSEEDRKIWSDGGMYQIYSPVDCPQVILGRRVSVSPLEVKELWSLLPKNHR